MMIQDWLPLLRDLRHYQRGWLRCDVVAGLSVAAVQVPTAVAYAQLVGFSPEVGLYASMLPLMAYALFGTSRQLIVGPDAATCAMVAAILVPLAGGDHAYFLSLSAALALMAGALMILGGTLRLGFIVNFFAQPILIGFLNGIALSIIAGQLGKLAGVALEQRDFLPSLLELAQRANEIHWLTAAVAAASLAALMLIRGLFPRSPVALAALVLATVAALLLGLGEAGVGLVGSVPSGLPSLGLPGLGYSAAQSIGMNAVGLVIVSFTSGMLTARSFAARNGYEIDANREMRAMGIANVASGLSGAFAISGADSRTAVNDAAGGKTQLVSLVAAGATALVALYFAPALEVVPQAALGAVLVFSAWGLLDVKSLRWLRKIDRFEFRLSLLTSLGVLTVGVLPGVVLAILLAIVQVLRKIYNPEDAVLGRVPGLAGYNDIALDPASETLPDAILYRFDGPLLFFNAGYFRERVRALVDSAPATVRWFVLSVESMTQTDVTGMQAALDVHDELQSRGIQLLIARPKLYMRKYGETMNLRERIGAENVFPTVGAAVEAIARRSLAAADSA